MIDRATELRRLAQVLHRKPEELDYLEALDGEGLSNLRTLVQNSLLEQFSGLFQKLASSGKLVPDSLSAFLCRRVFGAALTANMSYYVPVDRAARLCKHFDGEFMAAIAREMIPERAKALLDGLPVDLMREVMRRMLKTREYHIMGAFTDHLPEHKATELMREIADVADLLRISGFAQRKDRVARLAVKLDDDRLKELIAAAFAHAEFMLDIALVTGEMSPGEQRRMAQLTDELNPAYRKKTRELAEKMGFAESLGEYFAA